MDRNRAFIVVGGAIALFVAGLTVRRLKNSDLRAEMDEFKHEVKDSLKDVVKPPLAKKTTRNGHAARKPRLRKASA